MKNLHSTILNLHHGREEEHRKMRARHQQVKVVVEGLQLDLVDKDNLIAQLTAKLEAQQSEKVRITNEIIEYMQILNNKWNHQIDFE